MEFYSVIQNIYSCRAFAVRMVEQEKVGRILEAGRIAPRYSNRALAYRALGQLENVQVDKAIVNLAEADK